MLELFSPAKINLTFRVLHKRSDGFHQIASLYQAIELGDRITLSVSEEDHLISSDPQLPTDRSNLIWKAVDLFRAKTGCTEKVEIELEKKIPTQSGLGGGSSNAATTLYGLNQLFQMGLDDRELSSWGGEIGSDVPFFFTVGRALCSGRGEECKSLLPEDQEVWIAKPKGGLSTPEVYRNLKIHPKEERPAPFFNDLESSAFELRPELAKIKASLLAAGFASAQMTGSGTAFFCIGTPKEAVLPGITLTKTQFACRPSGSWYKFPKSTIVTLH